MTAATHSSAQNTLDDSGDLGTGQAVELPEECDLFVDTAGDDE